MIAWPQHTTLVHLNKYQGDGRDNLVHKYRKERELNFYVPLYTVKGSSVSLYARAPLALPCCLPICSFIFVLSSGVECSTKHEREKNWLAAIYSTI